MLLKGTLGRVDLPGADVEKLGNSLRSIAAMSGDLDIYPGHGEKSSLEDELLSNFPLMKLLK